MNTRRYRAACPVIGYRLCFFAMGGIMGYARSEKKITCADMRDSGVHGVVVYCSDISLRAKGGHASGDPSLV